jgi:acyl-CoA synthetase (AMP-forming)/AMP-acid ligase II
MIRPTATPSAAPALPDAIRTVPEMLAFWAERTPHAPALRGLEGQAASFRELETAVAANAARLTALGIAREDRVALVLPLGFDACLALLGSMTVAGAAPLNPALTAPELRRDLARLAPRLLVTGGAVAGTTRAVGEQLGLPTLDVTELAASEMGGASPRAALPAPDPDDVAAILHTSGSTGLPKRVPRPQRTFLAGARAARLCNALTADDVLLLTSGLHSNMGLTNLCAALASGGCCVATTGVDPDAFPDWLDRCQPTWTVSTVTELELVLAAAVKCGRAAVAGPRSRLRIYRVGAQPKTPGLVERAEPVLGALVFDGFGMTEATYIAASGPHPESRRPGACGRSLGTEIRVLDGDGRELSPGAVGEVVIRGEAVFPGYLDDPAANAALFLPGGWFRTGDLGHLDADGYLYLRGRSHELINRGGEKIAPAEVDDALLRHPAVAEAAVFAVPDARLGEDIVAAVVFRPGMAVPARELRAWLLDRVAPFKAPRRMWAVARLPRTDNGKVQRGELTRRWIEHRS